MTVIHLVAPIALMDGRQKVSRRGRAAKARARAKVNRKANVRAPMPVGTMMSGTTMTGVTRIGGAVTMAVAEVPAPVLSGITRPGGREVVKDEAAVRDGREVGDVQR